MSTKADVMKFDVESALNNMADQFKKEPSQEWLKNLIDESSKKAVRDIKEYVPRYKVQEKRSKIIRTVFVVIFWTAWTLYEYRMMARILTNALINIQGITGA